MCEHDLEGLPWLKHRTSCASCSWVSSFILSCFPVSSYRQACGLGIKMMRDITHLQCLHGQTGISSFPCLSEVITKTVTWMPCKCCVVWAFSTVRAHTHTHRQVDTENWWDTFYSNKLMGWITKGLSLPLSWDLQPDNWLKRNTSLSHLTIWTKKQYILQIIGFWTLYSFIFFEPQKGGKKETKGRFWFIW